MVECAKPERHGRPAESRAHFLKLSAAGTLSIRVADDLYSAPVQGVGRAFHVPPLVRLVAPMSNATDLAVFLLARIAEDESLVKSDRLDGLIGDTWMNWVLAECATKRRIVARCRWVEERPDWANDMEIAEHWGACAATLDALAQPYAGRDGWDTSWGM